MFIYLDEMRVIYFLVHIVVLFPVKKNALLKCSTVFEVEFMMSFE